jgi:hypothetical protein
VSLTSNFLRLPPPTPSFLYLHFPCIPEINLQPCLAHTGKELGGTNAYFLAKPAARGENEQSCNIIEQKVMYVMYPGNLNAELSKLMNVQITNKLG